MIRYAAIAIAAAMLYAVLGSAVSHVPPFGVDLAGRAVAGEAPRLALLFTRSCLWYTLVGLGLAGIAVAFASRAWRARIVYAIVVTVVTWQVSDALKNLFHRARPGYWHLLHETSYSYSSGHAMFATIVYALWAYFIWKSDLPDRVRFVVSPLLALWAAGVIWSRLALGAHYVTDLLGGVLLGVTALATGCAVRAALPVRDVALARSARVRDVVH